jgi:hypothetical protein
MSDFQWDRNDIEKFKKIFMGVTTDIRPGDIRRKNEFSKAGRRKPDVKDFAQLMRLVVQDGSARVKQGLVCSKSYKIQMVSNDYPFVQNIFDDCVFGKQHIPNPMPVPEEILKKLPNGTSWDEVLQRDWEFARFKADMFTCALEKIYIYHGFNLDFLFECVIDSYGNSVVLSEWKKEQWALEIRKYISMYQAFSIGRQEILDNFGIDHNKAFLIAYGYNFIRGFLSEYWDRSHSKKVKPSKHTREAVSLWETGHPIPEKLMKAAFRNNRLDPHFRYAIFKSDGDEFVPALKESADPLVVKYCNQWLDTHAELLKLPHRHANK